MRFIKYLVLLSVLVFPMAHAKAQVAVSVYPGGYGDGYAYGPPACSYGYYGYAPYACAPYGFYGPSWFSGGIFIGAGPWLRGGYGFGRGYGYGYRGVYGGYGRGYGYGGGYGRGYVGGYRGGYGAVRGGGYGGGRGFGGGRR